LRTERGRFAWHQVEHIANQGLRFRERPYCCLQGRNPSQLPAIGLRPVVL